MAVVKAIGEGRIAGEGRIEGDYLVGCDGAMSQVRRSLFGSEFPRKTWDAQIVTTDVRCLHLNNWKPVS